MPDKLSVLVALEQIRDALVVQRYKYLTDVKPNVKHGFMVQPLIGVLESGFTFMVNNLTILHDYLEKS